MPALLSCISTADAPGRLVPVAFGEVVNIECPFSEVHMFMRSAGKVYPAMATPGGALVFLPGTGTVGVPTTLGEPGFHLDRLHMEVMGLGAGH